MAKKEEQTMSLHEKLSRIQVEFKAAKSKFNSFGKYNFRSAEDILEALKPFNEKYGVYFTIQESIQYTHFENNLPPIMESRATIHDIDGVNEVSATAIVGVDLQQKGMQTPQAFGSASSYGKKYALGNLLLIDDTQDPDASNTHGKDTKPVTKTKLDVKDPAFEKAKEFVKGGGTIDTIKSKYDLTTEAASILSQL
jgi:hypothetical protein